MAQKTHWKKIVSDPKYIGEADFEPGEVKVLTLDYVNHSETVTTAEGKSQKGVVHWKEPGNKPMIMNVARSRAMADIAGSDHVEDWYGVQFPLYIEKGIKSFGDVVNAVRVFNRKDYAAWKNSHAKEVPPCTDCGGKIKPAMGKDASWLANYTTKNYGAPLCSACAQKRKQAAAASTAPPDAEPSAAEPETTEPETPEVETPEVEVL